MAQSRSTCGLLWAVCVAGMIVFGMPVIQASALTAMDDNDQFTAYIGSNAYQFSPYLNGDLGVIRLYSVLSHPDAASRGDWGRAFWLLEIRGPVGSDQVVRTTRGWTWLDDRGEGYAEFIWDGRNTAGNLVPQGIYRFTFKGRFLPDYLRPHRPPLMYEDLESEPGTAEAFSSTAEIMVNYSLDAEQSQRLREMRAAGACQVQQNAPLETSFGYNFYYGSTHSHSNYSDGGHATTSCASGNGEGTGVFGPAEVFSYARNEAGMDYWFITDHNHLFDEAVSNSNAPLTEAKVKQRYADGLAAAVAASVDGSFVALYGFEFGVLTNSDQGHVIVMESPKLFGWETCSTCTGASQECTTGSNCYFDVYSPKRYGYLSLYEKALQFPSAAGALGILCHPDAGHFDNFAFNTNADGAMQGIAVRSGLAFSTSTDCGDANVASSDYFSKWMKALNKGFHVAPTADQDAHCNNYGVAVPTRTVYLLPKTVSPVLNRANLMNAHKTRHFFATEDPNVQLVFATSDGSHIMGDIFTAGSPLTLRVAVYDPAAEPMSAIEIWRGQIGGGELTAAYQSNSGLATFQITESLTSGTYYYFAHARQADGHDIWSAPMWITYSGGTTTYSIAGATGTSGVTVTAGSYSATSDASGNYTLSGLPAGTYTVTSAKSGCTFSPTSLSVTVGPNATGKNFTATCGSSGDILLTSGVTLTGQSVAKSAWKYYYITVPAGATSLELKTTSATADVDIYTQFNAKPASATYTCRPYSSSGNETCTQSSPSAGTWWLGVYGYAAASFSVTGTVTAGGTTYTISGNAGTSGVTVTAGSASASSDASSNYTITGLAAGTYTVTPSKSGYTFSPASLSVTVGPNATGKNFTATASSGDTQLTSGVSVTGQSVTQGAWKYYYITVPAGAATLEFVTTNATADVDIYSQFNTKPTSAAYTCRPYSGTGNETCTHSSPTAGTWWLGVYGYAAASYTVTATVTTGTTTQTERLVNGGFETITASTNTAPDSSWQRSAYSGTSFNTLVANSSYPHTGTDHAYLGVYNSSSQTLDSTTLTIPAGATSATLSFWVSVVTSETGTTAYDNLNIQLVNSSGTVLTTVATLSNLNKTSGAGTYVQKSYSVIGYKGQTIKVRFKATNGTSYVTTFRVDDVSLKSDG